MIFFNGLKFWSLFFSKSFNCFSNLIIFSLFSLFSSRIEFVLFCLYNLTNEHKKNAPDGNREAFGVSDISGIGNPFNVIIVAHYRRKSQVYSGK